MTEHAEQVAEPTWLRSMRAAAQQRPRTQFQRIRWAELQALLRERDTLWNAASPETRAIVAAMRANDTYAYYSPDQSDPT